MKILNLVQGSAEWLKAREEHFNASEAPSIFGESKYKSRTVLLNEKKGVKEKVSDHLQKLFDKGHETEDKARDLLEFETAETFEPIVATLEVECLPLLASLDGISEDHKTIFEHKLWNEVLAENVRNNVLEPTYYWQLEQQLLVAGAERALFVVSDGTSAKREMMYYTSKPERRTKLIAGWHEFKKDLEAHEVKAKQEVVVAAEQKSFPLIKCDVEGSTVISNLGEFIPTIKAAIDERLSVVLETDQDFADTEAFVKNLKVARSTLKEKQTEVTNAFESYSAFVSDVQTTDTILQKAQSQLDKAVKQNKESKKLELIVSFREKLSSYGSELWKKIPSVELNALFPPVEWDLVIKNKRSIKNMEEALEGKLAQEKIKLNDLVTAIYRNVSSFEELANEFKFLFNDYQQIITKENMDFVNLIKARIAEHEQAEAERKRQEQERIEREAKEKAEREAQAKIEAQEKRIRDEERAKVEAEQKEEADRIAQIKANDAELHKREQPEEKPVEQRLAERFADTSEQELGNAIEASIESPTRKQQYTYEPLGLWPSDYDVSQNDELARVCQKLEEAEAYIESLTAVKAA